MIVLAVAAMIIDYENELFDKWKAVFPNETKKKFVPDGVVDEASWSSADIKVLYLLKEVNGADTEWDLRQYLLEYSNLENRNSTTMNNLIRWHYGVVNSGRSESWSEVERNLESVELLEKLFAQICVVNIKKIAGGGTVDWDNFEKYLLYEQNGRKTNLEYLKSQLELYKPDFIICGKTSYILPMLYGKEFEYENWLETSRGIRYLIYNGIVYIDFCHPYVRAPKNMVYYSLVDAVEEIKAQL